MSILAQKTESERVQVKKAKKSYYADRRKLNPSFVKGKGNLGLKSNDLTELSKLLKLANDIDINTLS